MIANIAGTQIFGIALVVYLGIVTYLTFILTAIIGYTNFRGTPILPFKWHPRVAVTALTLATIHGFLALSRYFGF